MKFVRKLQRWERHHKIELFGIAIGILLVALLVDFCFIKVHTMDINNGILDNYAIYVNEFTTSLSGVTGNISQVYVNPERTKCVILLYFDDTSKIVADATKYQIFVKGYDVNKARYANTTYSNPTGGYYVFGATGYSAIYLTDASGFSRQCLECIVRCNEVLVSDPQLADEEAAKRDETYAEFDQWRVIINPCGKSAKVCDFLNDFDIVSLYQDAVIDDNETQMRELLATDISRMNASMKQIINYRDNLISLGVNVPSLPACIAGDTFEYEEEMLVYHPQYVFENGVDFDWYHYTLHDTSFLDLVKSPEQTDIQFFNSLQDYSASQGYVSTADWYMADGTLIDLSSASGSQLMNMNAISENIDGYTTALSDYYSTKMTYQCTDLVSYLAIEANMKDAGKYFTSNYNEYTITVW